MLLQTSIVFTLSTTQIVGAIGTLITVVFGGAVSTWKIFNRVDALETKVAQEQRLAAWQYQLIESALNSVAIDTREARDNTLAIMSKLEVPSTFDREFWEKKFEAERRAHKERLDKLMKDPADEV